MMGSKEKIYVLVAKDEPSIRKLYGRVLEGCGYAVAVAMDGEDAIIQWRRGDFDLIIIDIRMPVVDECSAAQEIRAQERFVGKKPIPIVALTVATHEAEAATISCQFNAAQR